ncbi:MAG: O-antigen ligase family protein, partial [Spirochaetota bacterium]
FFLAAVMLQSRGAILSILIFFAGYLSIRLRRAGGISKPKLAGVCAGAAGTLLLFAFLQHFYFIFDRIFLKTRLQFSSSRVDFWMTFLHNQAGAFSWKQILFGFGAPQGGVFPYNTADPSYNMHNFIFELWGRYGVICAFFAAAAVAYPCIRYVRKIRFTPELAAFAAVLADNLFEDYLFFHIHLFTSLFAIFLLSRIIDAAFTDSSGRIS